MAHLRKILSIMTYEKEDWRANSKAAECGAH